MLIFDKPETDDDANIENPRFLEVAGERGWKFTFIKKYIYFF